MSRQFAGIAFGIAFGVAVACGALGAQEASSSNNGPGATWLAPLTLRPGVAHWRATIRRANDTTDRPLSEKTVAQTLLPGSAGDVMIASAWRPPLTSIDTLVFAEHGLVPEHEVLAFNGYTRRFQYAGGHVSGSVQHGDSAARAVDHVFSERVFAFNEVDLLVRSAPFRRDWSVVVPLFSEVDEAVEHDTITVVAPTRVHDGGGDREAWTIRFADPVIVSTYTVLADSRDILAIDTEQRQTHAIVRYRIEGTGGH